MAALREVLLHRKAQRAQKTYAAHLTWLIGAQLFALGGGQDYPVPDIFSLFPDSAMPRDRRSAQSIRQTVLMRLNRPNGNPNRKETDHG